MPDTFDEYLNTRQPGPDVLEHAARMLLAEETNDLPEASMRQQVIDAVGDPAAVSRAEQQLQRDPASREWISREFLADLWERPGGPKRVAAAVDDAESSLPVIEIAILSAAAMYIAYLHYTGGLKSEEERKTIGKDGSSEIVKKRKWYSATDALAAIGGMLSGIRKGGEKGEKKEK
jgi:hypothetical protein